MWLLTLGKETNWERASIMVSSGSSGQYTVRVRISDDLLGSDRSSSSNPSKLGVCMWLFASPFRPFLWAEGFTAQTYRDEIESPVRDVAAASLKGKHLDIIITCSGDEIHSNLSAAVFAS